MNPKRWLRLATAGSFLWAAGLGWWSTGWLHSTSEQSIPAPCAFDLTLGEDAGTLHVSTAPANPTPAASVAFDVLFELELVGRAGKTRLTYDLESRGVRLDDQRSIVLTLEAREMYELLPHQRTWRQVLTSPHPDDAVVLVKLEGAPEAVDLR
jgi:hypothetical protein